MFATAIVADGRMAGDMTARKSKVVDTFHKRGLPPRKVAEAILDAVRTNPAVRPVGTDAKLIAALTRVAPRTLNRLAGELQRRFGVP
jgi:hypothetical protein